VTHFGQAQHKRLDLEPVEHLRRQAAVLDQRIAVATFAADIGATVPQALAQFPAER